MHAITFTSPYIKETSVILESYAKVGFTEILCQYMAVPMFSVCCMEKKRRKKKDLSIWKLIKSSFIPNGCSCKLIKIIQMTEKDFNWLKIAVQKKMYFCVERLLGSASIQACRSWIQLLPCYRFVSFLFVVVEKKSFVDFISLRNAFTFLQNVDFNSPFLHFASCINAK